MPTKMVGMDDNIMAAWPAFKKKIFEIENKYLYYYMQMLVKYLDLLKMMYLKKHKMILIALILSSCKQAHVISKYFNTFPPASQIKIMHAILDKEETHLYILIKFTY